MFVQTIGAHAMPDASAGGGVSIDAIPDGGSNLITVFGERQSRSIRLAQPDELLVTMPIRIQ
jgi:hypothetical protein